MNYLEAIVELKNIISPKFIDRVLPFIDHKAKNDMKIASKVTENNIDKSIRNVKGYQLYMDTPTDMFYWNFIKQEIERLFSFYTAKFPWMQSTRINQIDLLKYGIGGKYNVHIDNGTNFNRHLSIIMNLNNNYKGGDLIFANQKGEEMKRIKLDKGSIVFFPSNFMYPHGIQPVTKGNRYSIVSWLE